MKNEKIFLSIVVPVYNEEKNIPILYARTKKAIDPLAEEYEFIFVDDGSSDTTVPSVLRLRQEDPHVKLISLSRNFSHQIALTAGLDYALGNAVVCMDADLQHPPEMIPQMVQAWREGNDIVATKRIDAMPLPIFKRLTAAIFYKLMKQISEVPIDANSAEFCLLDRQVVDILKNIRERNRFLRGLVNWVGFRKVILSYRAGHRLYGHSKYSFSKMVRFATDGIVAFSEVPLIIAAFLGAALSFFSFLYGCFVLYQRLFTHKTPAGWASVLASVLFSSGLIMLFLGIQGMYIASIHNEVKKRPLYIIKDAVGVTGSAVPD